MLHSHRAIFTGSQYILLPLTNNDAGHDQKAVLLGKERDGAPLHLYEYHRIGIVLIRYSSGNFMITDAYYAKYKFENSEAYCAIKTVICFSKMG